MSIVTLGLDPIQTKLTTLGYGPDIVIEITVLPGTIGKRGNRPERDRIIRIRVMDDSGKAYISEQLIPENDLKNIQIKVSESTILNGQDIFIVVKEMKDISKPVKLTIKAHEIKEKRKPNN